MSAKKFKVMFIECCVCLKKKSSEKVYVYLALSVMFEFKINI